MQAGGEMETGKWAEAVNGGHFFEGLGRLGRLAESQLGLAAPVGARARVGEAATGSFRER